MLASGEARHNWRRGWELVAHGCPQGEKFVGGLFRVFIDWSQGEKFVQGLFRMLSWVYCP